MVWVWGLFSGRIVIVKTISNDPLRVKQFNNTMNNKKRNNKNSECNNNFIAVIFHQEQNKIASAWEILHWFLQAQ